MRPLSDENPGVQPERLCALGRACGLAADADGLRWLRLTLIRAGCEEQPRLCGVSDRRYQAAQQQTRACSHWFTVEAGRGAAGHVEDALARARQSWPCSCARRRGWDQLEQYEEENVAKGRTLPFDAQVAAMDGADNVLVVCLDPVRA